MAVFGLAFLRLQPVFPKIAGTSLFLTIIVFVICLTIKVLKKKRNIYFKVAKIEICNGFSPIPTPQFINKKTLIFFFGLIISDLF